MNLYLFKNLLPLNAIIKQNSSKKLVLLNLLELHAELNAALNLVNVPTINNDHLCIKLLGKNLRLPDEEKYEIVKSMEKINIVRLKKRTKSIKISWNSFPLILTAQKKKEQSKNEQ